MAPSAAAKHAPCPLPGWWLALLLTSGCLPAHAAPSAGLFNGFTTSGIVGNASSLKVTNGITIEAWIKPGQRAATSDADGCIVLKEGEYQLARFADGTIRWALATTSPAWNWYSTGFVAPEGVWTHVALTYDGQRVRTYGNGRLVQTQTASGPLRDVNPSSNTFEIGSRTAAAQRFSGLIDEVRLWNLARSSSEIRDHYQRLLAGNEIGLIGYWRFDEGAGTTFRDSSPFHHDGTFQGAAWSKEPSPVGLPSIHLEQMAANSPTNAAASARLIAENSPAATFVEWAPGLPGLNLDGIDDFVSVPHDDVLNGDPSNGPFLTATAWVKVDPGGSGGLVNKYAAGSSNGWQMYLYNGELRAWYFASNTRHVWGPTVWTDRRGLNAGPIDDGLWHHAAFQVDTSGGYLYVDGALRASLRWTGAPARCSTTQSLSFGRYAAEAVPGFQFLEGVLGEVALWRTDLPAGAIQETMRGDSYYPDFLVGRWRFDLQENDLVEDLSGNGHLGFLVGQPVLIPAARPPLSFPNRVSTAAASRLWTDIEFDGVDDHLESAGDLDLANQSFTIEFWARRASTGTFQSVFSQTRGNSQTATLRNRGLHIGWRPNDTFTFAFFFNDLDTPEPWSDLDWHHWACTYDKTSGKRRIYRDGVLVAEDISDTPYNGAGPVWIGLRDFSPADDAPFHGAIRDVRVWAQSLTQDALQSWQDRALDARHPAFGSLKAWWPMAEGAGTTAKNGSTTDGQPALNFIPTLPGDGPRWQAEELHAAALAGLPISTPVFVRAGATNNYGATFSDPQLISLPTPISGNALSLDRIPAVARLGPYDDLKATSAFTVELWVHPIGVATNLQILAIREGEYGLSRSATGRLQVVWNNSDNAWVWKQTDAFLPTNVWTHVAMTFDSASVGIFTNGIKASQLAASGNLQDARPTANTLELGRSELATEQQFTGMLDDLRLWNVARVPSEIRRDFNLALTGNEPGLIAYYPFDEGFGDGLRDHGPRGLDGRLVGAVRWVASTSGIGQVVLTTSPATETEYGKPVLHGTVKSDSRPLRAYFVWGEGAQWTPGSDALSPPVYTAATTAVSLPGLLYDQPISAPLPLLGPGTYQFAIRVETEDGVLTGNNQTFVLSSAGGSAAIRFDGTDDFVQLGTDPVSKMSTAFTVEAWIQPQATNRAMMIVNREGEYELGISTEGELWWAVANRSRWIVNRTGFVPPVNLWTHVALVFDAGVVRVFRDGILVQTSTGTGTATALGDQHPDANELRVGSRQLGGTYFAGLIDEVRLWNIAVSQEDLQRRQHQRLRGDESGLVLYLPFDEGMGTTSGSLAGNINGTLTNGAVWAPSSLTLDMPPGVGITGANPLLATAATLAGWVNPAGSETVAWFTWWPVTNRAAIRQTPNIAIGSGEYRVPVSSSLSGLPATSTFEFQLHASSQHGTASTAATAFTTLALECGWPLGLTSSGPPPAITTLTHDKDGNTIVAGQFSSTTTFGSLSLVASAPFDDTPTSGFVAKVTPAGEWLWARSFEAHRGVTPRHAAMADDDSILIVGDFGGRLTAGNTPSRSSAGESDGFAARLSSSGDWLWSLQLGAAQNATLARIAVHPNGTFWCVGAFRVTVQNAAGSVSSAGGSDVLLASLDLMGSWRYLQRAGGTTDDAAVGIQVLPSGEPLVAGNFTGTAHFDAQEITSAGGSDFFVAQADGTTGWRWAIRGGGPGLDQASDLATTRDGAIVVAGQAVAPVTVAASPTPAMTSGTAHQFVASISTNQNLTWYSSLPGVTQSHIAVGPSGKVRLAAEFNRNLILPLSNGGVESFVPNSGSSDLLLAQLDPISGARDWARQIGSSATDLIRAIAVDADDFTTFAGIMGSSTPFGEVLLSAAAPRAFLARVSSSGAMDYNAWTIGAPVPVPDAARRADGGAFSIPLVTIRQPSGAAWTDYFHWSPVDSRLYPIRPVAFAEIAWAIDATPTSDRLSCAGRTVWPKKPTLHVAGVPTDLEIATPDSLLSFHGIAYSENQATTTTVVDLANPARVLFQATQTGFTTLRYLETRGATPDPSLHPVQFEVVRTLPWDHPDLHAITAVAVVGLPLSNPQHEDPSGRKGYVLRSRAPVDIAGPRPAHDRANRRGPIVPVNRDNPADTEDDLIVTWFRRSPHTGVPWPNLPVHYEIRWPDSASNLVIASGKGSGLLPVEQFPEKHVYSQSDASAGGFNPNEEHAFLIGDILYALRSDLNSLRRLSEPWVLLKFRSGSDWAFKLWRVVPETAEFPFRYAGIAGSRLLPPEPLASSGTCIDNRGVSGPVFKDYQGNLWARAAGRQGTSAVAVARFSYPLLDSFFFDLDGNGSPDVSPGSCVPWLDRLPGATPGQGVDVTFDVRWPDQVPTLQIGETLMDARNGLPAVQSFAQASILYDDGDPVGTNALQSVVRLFDPIVERTVPIATPFVAPSDLATVNDRGRLRFPDLPQALRSRLSIIPSATQPRLAFSGYIDASKAGDPLLLPNIMTPIERERLRQLTSNTAFQSAIDALFDLTRNPNRLDLDRNGSPDRAVLVGLAPSNPQPDRPVHESLSAGPKALTAGLGTGTGYVTLVENNDASLAGLPVSLHVLRVEGGPYRGQLQVILPDNVFDERVTLRHSADFAGQPDRLEFEWYSHPADGFDPTRLPVLTDTISEFNGWTRLATTPTSGTGVHEVTLGEGSQSGLLTLSDQWYIVRYRGYAIHGTTPWSPWAGAPGGDRAQLVEGWVKRVRDGLNPFEARTRDFHASETSTYASMLRQAGERYEGDIAFNPSADNLNRVGLIEAYETVLRRGRRLSIDAPTPVNFGPANDALLLAAGTVADLYMLLGNEAFADAADPTIGFPSSSAEYGSLAPSIFAFQNQLDSLLEEELALLRGRDASAAPVTAPPVYNRLYWNLTRGDGEVAYAQCYQLTDLSGPQGAPDGFIDELDARTAFPQGHGDAWGHYLTATTTYYGLLRDPDFTWVPRSESVSLAGVPVEVDYLDERRFARAAALKARTGAEIADLTYRRDFSADTASRTRDYRDPDRVRAWGFDDWTRRASQGAYFDWVAANAILPAIDPDPAHQGIRRIDRTTVRELDEIESAHQQAQSLLDRADEGLNPAGLALGVLPFDIDPSQIDRGLTHFEQIHERSLEAMRNAVAVFDHANQLGNALRRNQDRQDEFVRNVDAQERDYKNRLIELFGTPFAGDIGPGGAYPQGYDGPDLYHYMYVDTADLSGESTPPAQVFSGFYSSQLYGNSTYAHFFPNDVPANALSLQPSSLEVRYPYASGDNVFVPPPSWGTRHAPGEIQIAISSLVQKEAALRRSLKNYDAAVSRLESQLDLLRERYGMNAESLRLKSERNVIETTAAGIINGAKLTQKIAASLTTKWRRLGEIAVEGVPKVAGLANDLTAPLRASLLLNAETLAETSRYVEYGAYGVEAAATTAKTSLLYLNDRALEAVSGDYETQQQLKQLEQMLREEPALRLEILEMQEAVSQASAQYLVLVGRGLRLVDERVAFRKSAAAETQSSRYRDMGFRVFRHDAIQRYRAQFDLSQRYAFLAAMAYDYETQSLGNGNHFLEDILRQRTLGQMVNGRPLPGTGLAHSLAVLSQNFAVLKGRLGFNNPSSETGQFSLRREWLRLGDDSTSAWQAELRARKIDNLWTVPEFRRLCRPFAEEAAGPQPALVLRFPTTITSGLNFFGWPLGPGDTAYDSTQFATKVRSVGVWFARYQTAGLANAPRVYLIPAGQDLFRSASGNSLATREWRVIDQKLPVPFPLTGADLAKPDFVPLQDSFGSLGDQFADIQRFSSFRAYHDNGFSSSQVLSSDRLIGRSVWNTDWMLIIPGATLLADPAEGLERFIQSVSDIKIYFQTYSYSGN